MAKVFSQRLEPVHVRNSSDHLRNSIDHLKNTSIHMRSTSDDIMTTGRVRRQEVSFDGSEYADGNVVRDGKAKGVNKKLMRLAVDSRTSTKRQSMMFDESGASPVKTEITFINKSSDDNIPCRKMKQKKPDAYGDEEESRFPRMEEMSHFHYSTVDFGGKVKVSLCEMDNEISSLDTGQSLTVQVSSKDKSWVVKRSHDDFVGLDRQIHRCLYDRRYSKLPELKDYEEGSPLDEEMVQEMEYYLSRFSDLTGNNLNCGPILNWLELDNHGNHLVVMEADDSAINVPAVAAGRAIKRYQAQAADEISLEVGDFLSVIDMPSSEETIWWRGKKGFEVGFFPSHCIEILGEKEINEQILKQLHARPVSKRRGKFISFLRFFFKSRPTKEELMQNGILRERVFGCDLGERLAFMGRDIPIVLEMCANVVEEHGICDGIYRLSGIMSNLQKLRVAFDCDEQPPDLLDARYLNDIHCISSLLKTYFRELPNPLFTYELYDKFVTAMNKDDDTERTVAFHHVIQRLPPPHYRTMNHLLRHLNYCASKADVTNMTAKNLSIVWAPNLLRPNVDDSVAALTEFRTQAIIVEYMIRNVDVFFDKNLASAAIAYYPEAAVAAPTEEPTLCARMVQQNNGPKLITLEEARKRAHKERAVESTTAGDSGSSRHSNKIKSTYIPPNVSAAPISPSPALLSLEEAQAARTSFRQNSIEKKNEQSQPQQKQQPSRSWQHVSNPSLEPRDSNSSVVISSPKRTRKWFGLFQKNSKSSMQSDEVGMESSSKHSVTYYTKKQSSNIFISGPTRSQSEFGLDDLKKHTEKESVIRTESYNSTNSDSSGIDSSMKSSSNSKNSSSNLNMNAPVATPDFDIDTTRLSYGVEEDDIMSAVVSVRAKYFDMEDAQRYPTPRRSFTIGSMLEFRKISDSELNVEPPTAQPTVTNKSENNITKGPELITAQSSVTKDLPVEAYPPYSSHRRGAPSIDSGYLSQGSTLNRMKDVELYPSSQSSTLNRIKDVESSLAQKDSMALKCTTKETEITSDSTLTSLDRKQGKQDASQLKRRAASPAENHQQQAAKQKASSPTTTVAKRRFSRSEAYKQKTPDSQTRMFNSPTVEKYSPPMENLSVTKSPVDTNNGVEAMVTSPRADSPKNVEYFDIDTPRKSSPKPINSPERPTTLDLSKKSSLHDVESPKSTTSLARSIKTTKVKVINRTISSPGSYSASSPYSTKYFSPSGLGNTISPMRETKNIPTRESQYKDSSVNDEVFTPTTTSQTTDNRIIKPQVNSSEPKKFSNSNNSSNTDSPADKINIKRISKRYQEKEIEDNVETVEWRYTRENTESSIPLLYSNTENSKENDSSNIISESSNPNDNSQRRHSIVQDKIRLFSQGQSPSNPRDNESNGKGKNRPISNPILSKGMVLERSEKTKSSPNLFHRGTIRPETRKLKSPDHEKGCSIGTFQKNQNVNSPTQPSYNRDFDVRCRLNDEHKSSPNYENVISAEHRSKPYYTRSTDRLVKSTIERASTREFTPKVRPQSELFNFQSLDNEADKNEEIRQQPISHSVQSINTERDRNSQGNSLHLSKSENKLSMQQQQHQKLHNNNNNNSEFAPRQIGNFPLTLRAGSVHDTRNNFNIETRKQRPVSMYENSQRSYYDNMNGIRYEML